MSKRPREGDGEAAAGRSARFEGRRAHDKHRRRLRQAKLFAAGSFAFLGVAIIADIAAGAWPSGGGRPGGGVLFLLVTASLQGLASFVVWPRDDPGRWERGAVGEAATASCLERLPSRRWFVLHDLAVPGSRANIDHLVIGPTGVWVIDSKAYRARLRARRGRLWAGSQEVATDAVRWEAQVVSGVLGERARPLVAVHGRGLRRRGRLSAGVRVVPAAALVTRLRRHRLLRPALSAGRARQLAELARAGLRARSAGDVA